MKKNMLFIMLLSVSSVFADDIWFNSPQQGDTISGKTLTISLNVPPGTPKVSVWIEQDRPGRDLVVWRGTVTEKDKYTATVDASKFTEGRYEVNAEYYMNGEDYDGDVDIWIGKDSGAKGEYFPKQ